MSLVVDTHLVTSKRDSKDSCYFEEMMSESGLTDLSATHIDDNNRLSPLAVTASPASRKSSFGDVDSGFSNSDGELSRVSKAPRKCALGGNRFIVVRGWNSCNKSWCSCYALRNFTVWPLVYLSLQENSFRTKQAGTVIGVTSGHPASTRWVILFEHILVPTKVDIACRHHSCAVNSLNIKALLLCVT